jgi:hypothetical protein
MGIPLLLSASVRAIQQRIKKLPLRSVAAADRVTWTVETPQE